MPNIGGQTFYNYILNCAFTVDFKHSIFFFWQKTNNNEALELLTMSLDSYKMMPLPLILFYDELIALLECTSLQPAIVEW